MHHSSDEIAVVGGGLAGLFAAHALLENDQRVRLFQAKRPSWAASPAAAGLVNVLTGKAMRLPAIHEVAWAAFDRWQASLPQELRSFVHHLPVFRPFEAPEEPQAWALRVQEAPYANWVRVLLPDEVPAPAIHAPWGGLLVSPGAWVDVPHLLPLWQHHLQQRGLVLEPVGFDHQILEPETASYQNRSFQAIVFAEGIAGLDNPWWPVAALRPLSGELIRIRPEVEHPLPVSVSRGGYILPATDATWVVGSTHTRGKRTAETTEAGRQELAAQVQERFPGLSFTVVEQRAGVRPTVRDHYPLLGPHQDFPRMWFCNGLGTKGLLFGAYLAEQLVAGLHYPASIDPAVWLYRKGAGTPGQ